MSTVPKAGDPPPANNAKTLTIGGGSGMYARPTAGGNASGDATVAPGAVPSNPIVPSLSSLPTGAPTSTGGTQAGPDFGHGSTQIVAQPDATGHPGSSGGTVGS